VVTKWQKFFPLKKSLIMERKNIELKSKNELDTLVSKVATLEAHMSRLGMLMERSLEQSHTSVSRLQQEQHQMASSVTDTAEFLKSIYAVVQQLHQQQQQQQQQQQPSALSLSTSGERDRDPDREPLSARERRSSHGESSLSEMEGRAPPPRRRQLPSSPPPMIAERNYGLDGGEGGDGALPWRARRGEAPALALNLQGQSRAEASPPLFGVGARRGSEGAGRGAGAQGEKRGSLLQRFGFGGRK
jgi:hypothetical protein